MAAKPKLFVLNKLPEAVEARIQRDYDARLNPTDKTYAEPEIVAGSRGMDGIVTSPTTPVGLVTMPSMPRLPATISGSA